MDKILTQKGGTGTGSLFNPALSMAPNFIGLDLSALAPGQTPATGATPQIAKPDELKQLGTKLDNFLKTNALATAQINARMQAIANAETQLSPQEAEAVRQMLASALMSVTAELKELAKKHAALEARLAATGVISTGDIVQDALNGGLHYEEFYANANNMLLDFVLKKAGGWVVLPTGTKGTSSDIMPTRGTVKQFGYKQGAKKYAAGSISFDTSIARIWATVVDDGAGTVTGIFPGATDTTGAPLAVTSGKVTQVINTTFLYERLGAMGWGLGFADTLKVGGVAFIKAKNKIAGVGAGLFSETLLNMVLPDDNHGVDFVAGDDSTEVAV